MSRSEIKLIIIEVITILILLLNIFVKDILNEYTMILFLGLILGTVIYFLGYEKSRILDKKRIIISTTLYSLAFLIFLYGAGLIVGFAKTSYSLTTVSILQNTIPVMILLIVIELTRYCILKKSNDSKIIFLLSILLFTLVDVVVALHLYDLDDLAQVLELVTVVVVPSLAKNFMLSDFSRQYGYEPGLVYQIIMNIYVYIMMIVPNFSAYLESVIMFLVPLALRWIVNSRFQKEQKEDMRDKHIPDKVFSTVFIFIMLVVIALCSNIFSYWIAAIGSGSMTPTINVGDAVIIDKTYSHKLEKLKVGDILVFKIKGTIYTHRIIDLKVENGVYSINTKGDRKGNVEDKWVVTNGDVVGVVKQRIPFIGYPTVWLNRILEGSKE